MDLPNDQDTMIPWNRGRTARPRDLGMPGTFAPVLPSEDALGGARPIRVLFVCLGNICRSPLAEGVFRHLVAERGLQDVFEIDSAGTGPWHVGEPPDPRMRRTARNHGLSIDDLRGRQTHRGDPVRFDLILAMDRSNLEGLQRLDPRGHYGDRLRLFREFDPEPETYEVPDPYIGNQEGFEHVYAIVYRTATRLLDHLVEVYHLTPRPA